MRPWSPHCRQRGTEDHPILAPGLDSPILASHTGSTDGEPSGSLDLESMTKDELYSLAQERDVAGRSSMTKDELIEALHDE